jgi:hypothetical protein
LTRKQYPFVYNTRNCQKSVRNDFARNVKSEFNNSKRDLKVNQRNDVKNDSNRDPKIDRRLSPSRNQGAFLNPPFVGIATRTLTAGTRYFVT